MRLQQDSLATIKNYLHAIQGVLLFLAWALTVGVFTRDGATDGRTGWYFGLCWLTIPILIYLVMVPMWSRARRFSNVYAFATLDAVSVILWLSAWAGVASYVSSGKGKGTNGTGSGCDNFKFGSPGKCKLSEGTIVLGVAIMLLFVGTSFISFRGVMHYKRTGAMPAHAPQMSADLSMQTRDAFSTNMRNDFDHEGDEHDVRPQAGGYGYHTTAADEVYAPVGQNDHDDLSQMRPASPGGPLGHEGLGVNHDFDTLYRGVHGHA